MGRRFRTEEREARFSYIRVKIMRLLEIIVDLSWRLRGKLEPVEFVYIEDPNGDFEEILLEGKDPFLLYTPSVVIPHECPIEELTVWKWVDKNDETEN